MGAAEIRGGDGNDDEEYEEYEEYDDDKGGEDNGGDGETISDAARSRAARPCAIAPVIVNSPGE